MQCYLCEVSFDESCFNITINHNISDIINSTSIKNLNLTLTTNNSI